MAERTLRFAIEELASLYPQLYLDPHIVACVAILRRYSDSPASFDVECENLVSRWLGRASRFRLEVAWGSDAADNAQRLSATLQAKPLVELASVALAFLLAHRLLRLADLDVTRYGDRADYRSQTASCVLEVSGTEILSELGRRHREKVAQARANPYNWDAYAVVCAFSTRGHRIRISGHPWEGPGHGESEE